MSRNSQDTEGSGLQRLQAWWLELPLSYRVNALLYLLGGAALLLLVTTLFSGDDDAREIEVGAGVVTTTTARAQPSTAPATVPAASSTSILTTTTAPAGVTTPAGGGGTSSGTTTPTTSAQSSSGTGGGGGGTGGGGSGGGGTDTPVITLPSGQNPACRDSGDERCGAFRWDPAVTPDSPIDMVLSSITPSPRVGQPLNLTLTARDPDHLIPAGCWVANFGDGSPEERGPCPTPPECPPHFGPWTPPPPQLGSFQHPLTHTFSRPGTFEMTFSVSSVSSDRCPELDPWASETTQRYQVTIAA